MLPHRRAITVVVVLPGQNENQPHQARDDASGERNQTPTIFEKACSATEGGEHPCDNEANQRRRAHNVTDEGSVIAGVVPAKRELAAE